MRYIWPIVGTTGPTRSRWGFLIAIEQDSRPS